MGHRFRSSSIALLICLSWPLDLWAQDETVQLTEEQINLNNRAVGLLEANPPMPKEAISLVQAAMVTGEKGDLLHLTLGRAYQLDNQCDKAIEEFDKALTAPGVEGLPEGFIEQQTATYREDLGTLCDGKLVIACEPDGIELSIKDRKLACGEPATFAPGTYEISARDPETEASVSTQVVVVGAETTETIVKLGSGKKDETTVVVTPDPPEVSDKNFFITGNIGVPAGYCLARLVRDGGTNQEANATDAAVCYGVQADIMATRAISDAFAIGGMAMARGVMANALGQIDDQESLALRGFDVGAGLQGWFLGRKVGLEFGTRWRIRRVIFQGETLEDTTAPLMAGPGLLLQLGDVIGGLDGLGVNARWMPVANGLDTLALDASIAKGALSVWLGYESWQGDVGTDGLTHRAEQVMLGVGYHWGD